MPTLTGLYYPFSVIPRRTVKLLALYFDQIVICANITDAIGKIREAEERSSEEYVAALERCTPDLDGHNDLSILNNSSPFDCYLAGLFTLRKFVSEIDELIKEGVIKIHEELMLYAAGGDAHLPARPHQLWTAAKGYEPFFELENAFMAFGSTVWAQPARGQELDRAAALDLAGFQFATSISAADKMGAELITDVRAAHSFLLDFSRPIAERQPAQITPTQSRSIASQLAVTAMDRHLPDFSTVPYSEILEIRHRSRDELAAFRAYASDFAATMKLVELPKDIEYEAQRFQSKIDYSIENFRKSTGRSRKKAMRGVVGGVVTAAPPALVATVFPNLPFALASAAVAGMALGKIHGAAADHFERIGELRNKPDVNGLSFLLRF
jgi:hypothetical protein